MKLNVTGKEELKSIKVRFSLAGPQFKSTNCCASGSHDNQPMTDHKKLSSAHSIPNHFDRVDAFDIRSLYGCLRP